MYAGLHDHRYLDSQLCHTDIHLYPLILAPGFSLFNPTFQSVSVSIICCRFQNQAKNKYNYDVCIFLKRSHKNINRNPFKAQVMAKIQEDGANFKESTICIGHREIFFFSSVVCQMKQ